MPYRGVWKREREIRGADEARAWRGRPHDLSVGERVAFSASGMSVWRVRLVWGVCISNECKETQREERYQKKGLGRTSLSANILNFSLLPILRIIPVTHTCSSLDKNAQDREEFIPGSGLPDQVSESIIDNVTPFANAGPPGISM
jgi:hypothetical protein